jgi:hypothetical protein
MENYNSPLQKYKRQPKLYIDLPSKGNWYPERVLDKSQELEVFSMTANNEINLKTPDALYSGTAVKKLIENCVPAIRDAWYIPNVDVDFLLAAIRMATYGDAMQISSECPECSNQDSYSLKIQSILDHYSNINFNSEIRVDDFIFRLRPLTYKEITKIQQESLQLQRILTQKILKMEESEEKQAEMNALYERMNDISKNAICSSVVEITTPDGDKESNPIFIKNFLIDGIENTFFNTVEETYIKNGEELKISPTGVSCSACNHSYEITPTMDQATFFVKG